jgi:hypothetical protein
LLKVYGRESTAVIEASDPAGTVLPKVAGRFEIKIQDGDATRVRVVDLNRNTGSMGLGGAVGTAFLCQPVGIAAEGGKPRRINGGILVLNGRAHMNEGGK